MAPEPTRAGRRASPSGNPTEQVVYDVAVEGLFVKGLGPRLTAPLKEKLRSTGIDVDAPLRPTYAREVWAAALEVTARELYPAVPTAEAFRLLGHVVLDGTANTMIGRTILALAKLIGPRRAIARLPQAFSSMNNFIECRHSEDAPNDHRVWFNECYGHPSYFQGGIEAALTATGARSLTVEVAAREGQAVTFRVRWA